MKIIKKLICKIFDLEMPEPPQAKPPKPYKIGDKVIVRSNEPEPYIIGTLIRYEEIGRDLSQIEIVKCSETSDEYWCGGIIKLYSKELKETLDKMPFIEQWNYLAHRPSQIEKKYSKEYKTYECMCESCVAYEELMKDFE